ncbi:putative transcriptional regulatory protein [Paramyrothecium foliicola]|nr:putative transcriptional regulatory protein [Paramyrothecium foliicola]
MASSFDFNAPSQRNDSIGHEPPSPPSQAVPDASHQSVRAPGNVTVYQTTGPDAHMGPILTPGSGMPALNPRSCVTCRRRKVRCDKQMPCSNCRRAQIPCIFPAPGRAPRQPRPKDPNAPPKNTSQREVELVKRLKKLEGIVEELSGQIEVESGGKGPSPAGSPEASHPPAANPRQMSGNLDMTAMSGGSPKDFDFISESGSEGARRVDLQQKMGRLVLNDHKGSTRYVSSVFWTKLNDELNSLREETQRLTDEESESDYDETPDHSPPAAPPMSLTADQAFILGYQSSCVDLRRFHPLASHVPFLWQVYQENVETLVKVLHVPSTEAIIRDARRSPESLTPANEALVFGIYFSAVVSLEPEEVRTNFGANKDDLVAHYRFALEQALAKAKFLNTADLAVLTALTLFLTVVRRYDESRFSWALTGLVVRIAQGMGLQRDGAKLGGLSPLEIEMRRRIWWAILVLDYRSSEEIGSDPAISPGSFDTQIPTNLNDADIGPTSTEIPAAREGRSDCAVPLVTYEICDISRQFLNAASAGSSGGPSLGDASIADREQMLISVYQRIEHKFLKHVVDESDPLYWVAAMIARIIMAKMCLVIYQPMLFPGSGHDLSEEIRERIFVAAIEIVEYNHKLNTDPRCKQYRWLFATYTNWHAIAYALVEICRRPWTALIERAWDTVKSYDRDPTEYAKNSDHVAVFLPMRKLFIRARKHRAAEIARLKANPEEARRLDFSERMNPASARFGPVPGTENTMEIMRQRWRALTRPDGTSPLSFGQRNRTPVPPFSGDADPLPQPAAHLQVPNSSVRVPVSGEGALPMDLSSQAIDLVNNVISQPAVTMADFWPLQMMSAGTSSAVSPGMTPSQVPAQHPLQAQGHIQPLSGAVLHHQAMQMPGDEDPAAYMWSGYPSADANAGFDAGAFEDTDMLGENFDWQDWSQSIRGLEMGSAP